MRTILVVLTLKRVPCLAGSGRMYSHFELARAAYAVANAHGLLKQLAKTNYPGPPEQGSDERSETINSGIFDNVLRLGCPIPK